MKDIREKKAERTNTNTNYGPCRLFGEEWTQRARTPLPRGVSEELYASRYRLTAPHDRSGISAGRPFLRFTKSPTEPNYAAYLWSGD